MEYSWKWFHEKTLKFSWKWFHEKKFEAIVDLLKYPHPFWTPCKYVSDFCRAPQKQNKHNSILADQQQSYMMTKWYINYKYPFFEKYNFSNILSIHKQLKKNSVKSQSHTRRNFGKKIIFFHQKQNNVYCCIVLKMYQSLGSVFINYFFCRFCFFVFLHVMSVMRDEFAKKKSLNAPWIIIVETFIQKSSWNHHLEISNK